MTASISEYVPAQAGGLDEGRPVARSTVQAGVVSGIPRIKVNNHETFFYQYEFSLLDALEAQNISAPYSCRGGYCGCCRARLLDGEVEYVQDSLVDLADDEILTCCCVPRTHIEVELPEG